MDHRRIIFLKRRICVQLNITTDYAIRSVLFLALRDEIVKSQEIANYANSSPNYIFKILRKLVDAGYVKEHRGVKGGYKLIVSPAQLTLWDIIELMEPKTHINRCVEDSEFCFRSKSERCRVHAIYLDLQNRIENFFKSYSIQRIIDEQAQVSVEFIEEVTKISVKACS